MTRWRLTLFVGLLGLVPAGCSRRDAAAPPAARPIYQEDKTIAMNGWTCAVSGRGDSPLDCKSDARREELSVQFSGHTLLITQIKIWANGQTWNLPLDVHRIDVFIDMDRATIKVDGNAFAGPIYRPRSEVFDVTKGPGKK